MKGFRFIQLYWHSIVLVVAPIVLLPIVLCNDMKKEFKCMYIIAIMAVYFVTETLPYGIIGALPMVLFPLLNILGTNAVTICYMKEFICSFFCIVVIALAMERTYLNNRIALKMLTLFGCNLQRISMVLTFLAMFMSCWFSDIATTAVMMPVTFAILKELEAQQVCQMFEDKSDLKNPYEELRPTNITICYFVLVAYATLFGACSTFLGHFSNRLLRDMYADTFPAGPGLGFDTFLAFNLPIAIFGTILTWLWVQFLFMGLFRPHSDAAQLYTIDEAVQINKNASISQKYAALGPIKSSEYLVTLTTSVTIAIWVYVAAANEKHFGDSTIAMGGMLLLFILPMQWFCWKWCTDADPPKKPEERILTWGFVQSRAPWTLIFLMGGGMAVTEAGQKSGMFQWLNGKLLELTDLPVDFVLLLTCLVCSFTTELTTNMAGANIFLPMSIKLAASMEMHPLYFMMPVAMSCCFCFLLPGGRVANAIASNAANIPTRKFIIAGIFPKLAYLLLHVILIRSHGSLIFAGMNKVPDWAKKNGTNSTG